MEIQKTNHKLILTGKHNGSNYIYWQKTDTLTYNFIKMI
jgi:hypothetical protein